MSAINRFVRYVLILISIMSGGTVHKEIFSFMRPEGGKYVRKEWRKLVRPVIKRWREFVEKYV